MSTQQQRRQPDEDPTNQVMKPAMTASPRRSEMTVKEKKVNLQEDAGLRLMPGSHEGDNATTQTKPGAVATEEKINLQLMPGRHEDDDTSVGSQPQPGAVAIGGDERQATAISSSNPTPNGTATNGAELVVASYVVEEDPENPTSVPSSSAPHNNHDNNSEDGPAQQPDEVFSKPICIAQPFGQRNKWKILIAILLTILIAAVVAVVVVLARPSGDNENQNAEEPLDLSLDDPSTPKSPPTTPAPASTTKSPTSPPPTPNPTSIGKAEEYTRSFSLREFYFQGNTLEEAASVEAANVEECKEYCANYEGALYSTSNSGDSCSCFAGIDCLVRWGDIDTSTVARGTLYTKELLSSCPFDFCQGTPDHWRCLTTYEASLKSYTLANAGGYDVSLTTDTSTEQECLELCATYEAARYSSSVIGDACICFSRNDTIADACLIPWGDQVDDDTIAFGYIFAKDQLSSCSFDWCDVDPNHWFCLTNNWLYLKSYKLDQAGGFSLATTTNTNNRNNCLEYCQEHDASRYASSVVGDTCECYDLIPDSLETCAIPWGDQVDDDTVAYGHIFSKAPLVSCSFDWCDVYPDDWFCLTRNKISLRTASLSTGSGFVVTASMNINSQNDCLEFCSVYFAARYAGSIAGDTCECYDQDLATPDDVCAIPWGAKVDSSDVAFGYIFTKEPIITCSFSFCDVQPEHAYCIGG